MRSGIVSGINSGINPGVTSGLKETKTGVRGGLKESFITNRKYMDLESGQTEPVPKMLFLADKSVSVSGGNVIATNLISGGVSISVLSHQSQITLVDDDGLGKPCLKFEGAKDRIYLNQAGIFEDELTACFVAYVDEGISDDKRRDIISFTGNEPPPPPGNEFDIAKRQLNCWLSSPGDYPGYFESTINGKKLEPYTYFLRSSEYNSKSNRHILRNRWNLFTVKFKTSTPHAELYINGARVVNHFDNGFALDDDYDLHFTNKIFSFGSPHFALEEVYDDYDGYLKLGGIAVFDTWLDDSQRVRVENFFRKHYNQNFL